MAYEDEVLQWRQQVETALRGEESWLSLAGLFWLAPRADPIGSGQQKKMLRPPAAPPPGRLSPAAAGFPSRSHGYVPPALCASTLPARSSPRTSWATRRRPCA